MFFIKITMNIHAFIVLDTLHIAHDNLNACTEHELSHTCRY